MFIKIGFLFSAIYWFALGKKVRARNRFRNFSATLLKIGSDAQASNEQSAEKLCNALAEQAEARSRASKEEIAKWEAPPLISVVIPVYNTDTAHLAEAIDSVLNQSYPHWQLCIADDASTKPEVRETLKQYEAKDERIKITFRTENGNISRATNTAIEMASGAFVAFVDHDDRLSPDALYLVAKTIVEHPDAQLIYSDEDKIRKGGHLQGPHFKPDWNYELFLTQNYVNHLSVIRRSLLEKTGGLRAGFEGSQDHDLILRLLPHIDEENIVHIPKILYHWRAYSGSGSFSDRALGQAIDARQRATRDCLAVMEPMVDASVTKGPHGCNRVLRELPSPIPRVNIIIPTRDQVDILKACIESIHSKTEYSKYSITIVDNNSVSPDTLSYFELLKKQHRVEVLSYPYSFNYAAINNLAVSRTDADMVALLNNDIEVITPNWLREMASLAARPRNGAVGAKLLYPNKTVQHAGVILGAGGIANHAHHGYASEDPGYHTRLQLPQEISAVTGACLVIEREKYLEVGGFDEENLQIAYNDLDLCLKLGDAGYRNIYTPYATLYHYESLSRGPDTSPEKRERLQRESEFMSRKWGERLTRDRFYSESFDRRDAQFRYFQKE